jgi:hypothetical protein
MTSPSPAFGDYQLEIYSAGLRGVVPTFPMVFAELEARAAHAMAPSVLSYVAGGAGSEHTQRANASAFHQWGLIPRMFVGATQPPTACAAPARTCEACPNGWRRGQPRLRLPMLSDPVVEDERSSSTPRM